MTTENRRKEEQEAKTEDSGRNLVQPTNSAMVDKAEREESILPDNEQAVLKAQEYIREGYEWVVDIDLEKFFDKVNHDILMSKVARKVKDKKILLLIRRFLQAGVMENGLLQVTEEGTPQGGPLSATFKHYGSKRDILLDLDLGNPASLPKLRRETA